MHICFDHVPQVDCDAAINQGIEDCDPTSFNLYTRFDQDPSSSPNRSPNPNP